MVAYDMHGLRDFVPNSEPAAWRQKERPLRGGAFDCRKQSLDSYYTWQEFGR